jgi:hypothetical protein
MLVCVIWDHQIDSMHDMFEVRVALLSLWAASHPPCGSTSIDAHLKSDLSFVGPYTGGPLSLSHHSATLSRGVVARRWTARLPAMTAAAGGPSCALGAVAAEALAEAGAWRCL